MTSHCTSLWCLLKVLIRELSQRTPQMPSPIRELSQRTPHTHCQSFSRGTQQKLLSCDHINMRAVTGLPTSISTIAAIAQANCAPLLSAGDMMIAQSTFKWKRLEAATLPFAIVLHGCTGLKPNSLTGASIAVLNRLLSGLIIF